MPVRLPFDSESPIYSVSTTLDGAVYRFDLRWNERDAAWYFDLYTAEDVLLRAGVKIVLGTPLGWLTVNPDFPAGVFLATDMSGRGEEATVEDLGTRVLVHFYTNQEIEDLGI